MLRWLALAFAAVLAWAAPARAERVPAQELRVGNIRVRFDEAQRPAAERILRAAPDALEEVAMITGDRDDRLEIRVAAQARRMAELAPANAAPPRWASGVAYPERGLILIGAIDPEGRPADLEDVLRHEIAHVSLHRATGGRPNRARTPPANSRGERRHRRARLGAMAPRPRCRPRSWDAVRY